MNHSIDLGVSMCVHTEDKKDCVDKESPTRMGLFCIYNRCLLDYLLLILSARPIRSDRDSLANQDPRKVSESLHPFYATAFASIHPLISSLLVFLRNTSSPFLFWTPGPIPSKLLCVDYWPLGKQWPIIQQISSLDITSGFGQRNGVSIVWQENISFGVSVNWINLRNVPRDR